MYLEVMSDIPVLLQPLHLGPCVAIDYIALLVLKAPGSDDQDISFSDPDLLLDLALDPPDACHPIEAADPYVVCTKHQFGAAKYLSISPVRQAHTDNLPSPFRSLGFGSPFSRLSQLINPIFQST